MPKKIKKDWSQVSGYVSPERLESVGANFKFLKTQSYELMELKGAKKILDVGCGAGIDTVEIARLVNAKATVYGIDHDEEMLKNADERASTAQVDCTIIHQYADVLELPFPDNYFDACRAERLFQNLPKSYDPDDVFSEILRVTKKGGKIVLLDADFGTISVDFEDSELERRLVSFYAEKMCPNGFAGRQFFRIFKGKKTKINAVKIIPVGFTSLPSFLDERLSDAALKAKIADVAEMKNWRETLTKKSNEGKFYCSVNVILIAGEKG